MSSGLEEHRTSEHLSDSGGSISRHSSIQGPYRDGAKDSSFPTYRTRGAPGRIASEIHSRSLFSTGNGTALSNPVGNLARHATHMKYGAFLGDVGYVNHSGYFSFAFNMFLQPDHPIHKNSVPPNFTPAVSGLSIDDSVITPNYHPAGTVISSPGITMTTLSEPPAMQFETSVLEGSVLVLPTGAAREDLVDPSRFYPYLKEHAVSWYQYYNGNWDEEATDRNRPNGTISIVVGVDRAESWAMATFPGRTERASKYRRFALIVKDANMSWRNDFGSTSYDIKHLTDGTFGVIFLRLITIALSTGEWSRHVAYIPPDEVQSYSTLSTRMFGLGARIQRSLPRIQFFSKKSALEDSELLFHPSIILLNILISTEPSATVAIVPDSVWISQLCGQHLTHPEVVTLIRKVIDNFDIETKDGIAIFSVKKVEDKDQKNSGSKSSWAAIASSFRWIILWGERSRPDDLRKRALENMSKILSL